MIHDEFDRVVRTTEAVFVKDKPQSGTMKLYAYTPQGKRTRLKVVTYSRIGGKMTKQDVIYSKWEYNKFGQLVKIEKGNDNVEYLYDRKGRVLKRTANDMETYYTYIPLGQLETKSLGAPYDKKTAIATLKYTYATDGTISEREVNGAKQAYKYDKIGQLTAVLDASGKAVEQYTYDPAGNILKKDVSGKVTTYTYDKANQLVSSTTDGKTTDYSYDAAGRLTKEGDKAYSYVWLDKVLNITQNGKVTNSYSYGMDGQIATANISGKQESFIWDGLALLKRDTTEYVNEPAVTGGNPILANGKGLFNDMLGTTLGKYDGKKFIDNQRTSFGSGSKDGFFTGKPHVAGLGYAFLYRNYRSGLGKWQTKDLLGYPDGWNNLSYVNNKVTNSIDWLGALTQHGEITDAYLIDVTLGGSYSEYEIVDGEYLYTITYMLSYQRFQQNTWYETECPYGGGTIPGEVDNQHLYGSGPIIITTTSDDILSSADIQLIIATSFTNWEKQHETEFGSDLIGKELTRTVLCPE